MIQIVENERKCVDDMERWHPNSQGNHGCRKRWKVEETGDESVGVDLIYFHTESDFQVPWCIMLCKGTPLWKAQVAPDRLKS